MAEDRLFFIDLMGILIYNFSKGVDEMKKCFSAFITMVLMLCLCTTSAFARSSNPEDYYKITFPGNYTRQKDMNYDDAKDEEVFLLSQWMCQDKDNIMLVSVALTETNKEYNFSKANDAKLQEYGNELLSKFDVPDGTVFNNAEKTKLNGRTAMKVSSVNSAEGKASFNTSTDFYFIAYGNTLYTLQFTSTDIDKLSGDEVKTILKSFSFETDKIVYIVIAVAAAVVLAVALIVIIKIVKANPVSGEENSQKKK